MKKFALSLAVGVCAVGSISAHPTKALRFNPDQFTVKSLTMPDGTQVAYKAYEGIYYVTNIEDSTYQTLNIYVPLDRKGRSDAQTPILMRNNVGGYMASPAGTPSVVDATGRALAEGFVLPQNSACI